MRRPAAPALGSDPTFPPCSPAPCARPTSAAGLWRPHDVVTLKVRVRGSVEDGTVITNRARFQGDLTVSPPAGVHFIVVRSTVARGTATGILL